MIRQLSQKGFTLIELLVVVAILGIIAIGLMVAIDPIEQINRSSDAAKRSLAMDVAGGFSRFYTARGYSAACPNSACATYNNSLSASSAVAVSTLAAVNTSLNNTGDTKTATSLTSHSQAARVYASLANTSVANAATIVLCWQPQSKLQKSDADIADPNTTVYNNMGVLQTAVACPATNANTCYQCVRQ